MTAPVMFCYAHPDDETFLSAGLIRTLSDQGFPPALLLATSGDAGHKNGAYRDWTREELGALREQEMAVAAQVLGIADVRFLRLPDGRLQETDEALFVRQVAEAINRMQPAAVFTFPPDGGNGHPDHRAISRIVSKAVTEGHCGSVRRLYYVFSDSLAQEGRIPAVKIDTLHLWPDKADALRAHDSQIEAIRRYFGDLSLCLPERRYEAFALAWEDGAWWPEKTERQALEELGLPLS
ncbi:PIG-L deacetylase family protein [Paenibacillus methanolicus]|uniref:LmbE family N-acetylglucosaminyl deacetylase n=1 Tax=Paenibacillus methanolicus TaxID=582686 RepID=A0A5S5C1M9_9BACL|nr:PIG-L family deacetylase [Paenibacillus methanolicus]TYP72372.1 LmbE family N-acetylglucosaminyl deacetylase [Paenibacillus methanolicus]